MTQGPSYYPEESSEMEIDLPREILQRRKQQAKMEGLKILDQLRKELAHTQTRPKWRFLSQLLSRKENT